MKRIAVIGSGFGGLAEAIRLQAKGFAVTIFEKRAQVGGRAYQLVKKGYTFDMGPSLVTAPFIIDRVFEAAGKSRRDYVDFVPLDPFYRIYFADGTFMDYTGDAARMKEEMAKFNPGDASQYDRFFEDIQRRLRCGDHRRTRVHAVSYMEVLSAFRPACAPSRVVCVRCTAMPAGTSRTNGTGSRFRSTLFLSAGRLFARHRSTS